MTSKQSSSIRASKLGKRQEKSHFHYVLYSFSNTRQTMMGETEDAPVHLEGWTWFLVSVDMKTIIAALPVSSSRSVVGCKEKSFTRDAATDFTTASLLPIVAVWQWRKVRGNVCLLLNFIPVLWASTMMSLCWRWNMIEKRFATVNSLVANFKQHFGMKVKIWPRPKINKYFSYW